MDCRTPGLPVHHQLLELAQTHVHESVMPKQVCFYRCLGPTFPIFGYKGVLLQVQEWLISCSQRDRKESQSVFLALEPLLYFCCAVSSLLCTAFCSCSERGFLLAVVSLVAEHRLKGAWASVVAAHELSCPKPCGIFPDQALNLCPLHWQANS